MSAPPLFYSDELARMTRFARWYWIRWHRKWLRRHPEDGWVMGSVNRHIAERNLQLLGAKP